MPFHAVFDAMIVWLEQALDTPAVYLTLVFVFSFFVAILLPIPIELALFLPLTRQPPDLGYYAIVAVVMAAGKAVGSVAVFVLGVKVEPSIRKWSERVRLIGRFVAWCERFVARTKYLGLFILLSIPGMSDTVPIYLYSLFNPDGKTLDLRLFALVNFGAALVRAVALYGLFLVGVNLFG